MPILVRTNANEQIVLVQYSFVSHYWANEISILGLSWAKIVMSSGIVKFELKVTVHHNLWGKHLVVALPLISATCY